jgi:nucleoside 2-deoxyribosyltransferase
MKIYFAGPLFTPYVRQFISEHAEILREHSIDPFVPHESFKIEVTSEMAEVLVAQRAMTRAELASSNASDLVAERMRLGKISREQLGLPPNTPERIFDVDYGGIANANAMVVLLDGTQVDDGTACEIGIFYGLMREDPTKKGIAGWMTDFRGTRKADHGYGLNLFVLGVIEECGVVFTDFDDVVQQLKVWQTELG